MGMGMEMDEEAVCNHTRQIDRQGTTSANGRLGTWTCMTETRVDIIIRIGTARRILVPQKSKGHMTHATPKQLMMLPELATVVFSTAFSLSLSLPFQPKTTTTATTATILCAMCRVPDAVFFLFFFLLLFPELSPFTLFSFFLSTLPSSYLSFVIQT